MAEPVAINVTYDGGSEKIYCEKVSETIYKCLESSFFVDFINYGCEIEVEEQNGELVFLWLFKESPLKDHRYIWSKEIIESVGCTKMKEEIIRIGGYWESAMGGFFIMHLPREKENEIDRLFEILNGKS
jgi:hypothetical protein